MWSWIKTSLCWSVWTVVSHPHERESWKFFIYSSKSSSLYIFYYQHLTKGLVCHLLPNIRPFSRSPGFLFGEKEMKTSFGIFKGESAIDSVGVFVVDMRSRSIEVKSYSLLKDGCEMILLCYRFWIGSILVVFMGVICETQGSQNYDKLATTSAVTLAQYFVRCDQSFVTLTLSSGRRVTENEEQVHWNEWKNTQLNKIVKSVRIVR